MAKRFFPCTYCPYKSDSKRNRDRHQDKCELELIPLTEQYITTMCTEQIEVLKTLLINRQYQWDERIGQYLQLKTLQMFQNQ